MVDPKAKVYTVFRTYKELLSQSAIWEVTTWEEQPGAVGETWSIYTQGFGMVLQALQSTYCCRERSRVQIKDNECKRRSLFIPSPTGQPHRGSPCWVFGEERQAFCQLYLVAKVYWESAYPFLFPPSGQHGVQIPSHWLSPQHRSLTSLPSLKSHKI